jgi:hypothetical protein
LNGKLSYRPFFACDWCYRGRIFSAFKSVLWCHCRSMHKQKLSEVTLAFWIEPDPVVWLPDRGNHLLPPFRADSP